MKYAPTYRVLSNQEDDTSLGRLAKQLTIFDVSTAYPLVFVIETATVLSDEDKQKAFRLIESYIVRRALCGLTPKAYNNTFLRIISRMRSEATSIETLKAAFRELDGDSVKFPTDEELHTAFTSRAQYGSMLAPRLKYVLEMLEMALRNDFDESSGMRNDLTIEHVLPQEWAEYWPLADGAYAPRDYMIGADDPRRAQVSARQSLKHTIGNLTLLTPAGNPRLSNYPFTVVDQALGIAKRDALATSLLRMNQDIGANASWDESAIVARGTRLAELAKAIWPYPD